MTNGIDDGPERAHHRTAITAEKIALDHNRDQRTQSPERHYAFRALFDGVGVRANTNLACQIIESRIFQLDRHSAYGKPLLCSCKWNCPSLQDGIRLRLLTHESNF